MPDDMGTFRIDVEIEIPARPGLNFRVEPVHRRLVDAGPAPAAAGLLAT